MGIEDEIRRQEAIAAQPVPDRDAPMLARCAEFVDILTRNSLGATDFLFEETMIMEPQAGVGRRRAGQYAT
ncbi:hypothetical protein [Williamsia muralis]|uniref:hypothetical protein n=1 Tax=Williamsia marianensis TaxID=85044 RepID=UPI0037FC2965